MEKEAWTNGPFNKLHHIAIVLRDAERAQGSYESIGIGPWVDYPPMEEYVKIDVPDEKKIYYKRKPGKRQRLLVSEYGIGSRSGFAGAPKPDRLTT